MPSSVSKSDAGAASVRVSPTRSSTGPTTSPAMIAPESQGRSRTSWPPNNCQRPSIRAGGLGSPLTMLAGIQRTTARVSVENSTISRYYYFSSRKCRHGVRSMVQRVHRTGFAIFTTLAIMGYLGQAGAAEEERFEISSIKAIRPTLVDTITALQQRDVARARVAFEAYDSGWNGIEVYVNTRSKDTYRLLELEFQPRITKALDKPNPDVSDVLADVQAMLIKFDEAVSMFANAAPLNPLYDDVARLRIVRAHLREVTPALKAGNLAKARKSFEAFEDGWFNIEDFVRAQSLDAYVAIETGMVQIEQALLMSDQPDVAAVTRLVGGVMNQYNAVVTEVQKEARSAQ